MHPLAWESTRWESTFWESHARAPDFGLSHTNAYAYKGLWRTLHRKRRLRKLENKLQNENKRTSMYTNRGGWGRAGAARWPLDPAAILHDDILPLARQCEKSSMVTFVVHFLAYLSTRMAIYGRYMIG